MMKMVAPESGVYKVKFATRPDATLDDLHTYGGARRRLFRGDYIGFSTDESGQVFALAGDELLPLGPRRNTKRTPAYLVWAYRPDAHPQNEFVQALLEAGRFIVIGTLVVGVVALWVWLELNADHDCEYEY